MDGYSHFIFPSTNINPCARPLGTYKTKMAVRTGKRSILAGQTEVTKKIGECKQSRE